jgi:hypothetical protein
MAARQRSGYLAIYKEAIKGTYHGSLLEALEILQKYLPNGMFPDGRINGRSIEYSYEKILRHIKKHLALENS